MLCGLLLHGRTEAACIESPDPVVRQLQDLAATDANRALSRADANLRELGISAPRQDIAWLHAVRAQAYSALELDGQARAAAADGLKLVLDAREPVHLALLAAHAENVYDAAGIAAAIESVEQVRAANTIEAVADTCLQVTLGTLQYRQDRSDLAIATLTQAYRAADLAGYSKQRMLAADVLSAVMREIGDHKQALELNAEVVAWYESHGETLALSVSQYLRGNIYQDMRDFAAAVAAFEGARALSVSVADNQGVAFTDMKLCEVQIELGQLAAARSRCESALRVFAPAQATDVIKQTQALLAQIDLAEGRSSRALAALDEVLADGARDMPPRSVTPLFRLRARANAVQGNFASAYADLDEYVKRYTNTHEMRSLRQVTGMRARFEVDREIERSAALQRELALSQQRETELRRRTWAAIVAGTLGLALLTAMLIGTRRHRRRLAELANRDGLTDLPNRRHTAQLAEQAIADAEASGRSLTLALIDLDHFKIINDQCGHAGGDQVLRDFAGLSRETLRATDTFGRWGGEEFLLVMPDTTLDVALGVVERLRARALTIRLPSSDTLLRVSLSAGLATKETDVRSLDALVARADTALYRAKEEGRNLVRIDAVSFETASSGVRRAVTHG
jgi:diguanylate cyclase (GGDEF)-like protein